MGRDLDEGARVETSRFRFDLETKQGGPGQQQNQFRHMETMLGK